MSDGDCKHDHIFHETKRNVFCKNCKVPMIRFRGDWIADPNAVAVRKKERGEHADPQPVP